LFLIGRDQQFKSSVEAMAATDNSVSIMNIGDILIAKSISNEEARTVISGIAHCNKLVVVNNIEECLRLPNDTPWITLYSNRKGRFPSLISAYRFEIDSSDRFKLSREFGVEIAWDRTGDVNPFVINVVYPDGREQLETLSEQDID
jgi:hypothetical protein